MYDIGSKIRKKRIELNLSQQELAEKMGYTSRSTITKIEKGENDIPRSKVIEMAKILKTTPAYLMGWTREDDMNFSKNLNFLMRKFNETANGLSLKTHISPSRIRELINGYDDPTTKELKVLAQHYKISNTDLLTNTLYLSDISYIESDKFNETMNLMMELNDDGIEKVNEYISDLSDKYRKR